MKCIVKIEDLRKLYDFRTEVEVYKKAQTIILAYFYSIIYKLFNHQLKKKKSRIFKIIGVLYDHQVISLN